MNAPFLWWQCGIIYQIYPRSFMDSNGDGVGDLPGILDKLDYLQWLGVDAIWISPIFPSPMADFGYDVSDYMDIHPLFGTLADFETLVAEAHRRRLKVILDYVPNHSSDRHPWFLESRASRDNSKRDWYLWRDPAPGGGPPNNWRSVFGGSAWEWDATTGQYYYHAYLKEQPDLNWRCSEVQEAMLDVLRFWLERGVDGFRVDALRQLIKDDQWRDNPPNPAYHPDQGPYQALLPVYTTDLPAVHEMIGKMRRVIDSYDDRLLIGELYLPIERLVTYYGVDGSGVHLPFNFHMIRVPWEAQHIAALVATYEAALPSGGWPNWVLGNHDQHRLISRIGTAQARIAAMLLLTLRGTPTLYYGDEIGMRDVIIPPALVQDPWEKNVPGLGLGRDPERTPMQWESGPNAGFTVGIPWLPTAADDQTVNVGVERHDPVSLLTLYHRLIALRRAIPALAVGAYRGLEAGNDILAYVREHEGRRIMVALNLGPEPGAFVPAKTDFAGTILLSTHLDRDDEVVRDTIVLRGDEGILVRLR
jgi:alpha-glucosidase